MGLESIGVSWFRTDSNASLDVFARIFSEQHNGWRVALDPPFAFILEARPDKSEIVVYYFGKEAQAFLRQLESGVPIGNLTVHLLTRDEYREEIGVEPPESPAGPPPAPSS